MERKEWAKKRVLLCLVNHSKDFSTCRIRKRSLISQLLADVFEWMCRSVNSISCSYTHVDVSVYCWTVMCVFLLDVAPNSQYGRVHVVCAHMPVCFVL